MAEHDNSNKERILSGEVTETTSSDAYIARNLATLQSEIEATGKIIDISTADIHRPKILASNASLPQEEIVEGVISINPLSRFVTNIFKERQEKKAA